MPDSSRYVYYPGGAPQFQYTAVDVKNRSHTITAEARDAAEDLLRAPQRDAAHEMDPDRQALLHRVARLSLARLGRTSGVPEPEGAPADGP